MLRPDTLVHERYRVVRLIGQGGFGSVYEAMDERLNRRVALKQLVRVNERISRQFTREAQLLANLHHPALPRVTDHFTEAAGPFLVMDYIPGDDLATLLYDRNAPFALDEALTIGVQILDVLHYLHTLQPPIIHRDIKPQNLKLRADGGIILLDFGLAKGHAGEVAPSSGASSMTAFTRGFAPPEQIEGTGTDGRSDLYALGATLYCLLTNAAPPEAQTRLLTVMRGRGDPLPPAHEINPALPEAVSQVLQQAMALEMDERPADAPTLRSMLQAARGGAWPMSTTGPSRAAISMPTEIDPPTGSAAHPGLEAIYLQGIAHMEAGRWVEARQSFEAVDRRVPGYRETRAYLAQLRQRLERQPTAKVAVQPAPNPLSQPDNLLPAAQAPTLRRAWYWPVLAGAAVLVTLATVLALQLTGVVNVASIFPQGPTVVVEPTTVVVVAHASTEASPEGLVTATPVPSAEASPATPTPEPAQSEAAPRLTATPSEPAPAPAPSLSATLGSGADIRQEVAERLDKAYAAFQQRGGLDEAIGEANAAAKLDPQNAEARAVLALLHMQRFDWAEVAKQAQAALELDPEHAAAYSFLSQAHREQGDLKQALADANKSIELQSNLSLGYTARAFVLLELADRDYDRSKVDEALADTEQAVELASDEDGYHRVEAYAAKASALASRHQFTQDPRDLQQAIEEYRQAIGSQVEIAWHYSNLGSLLSTAGRYEDAAKAFDAAIQRDPNFYGAYEGRAWMLYAQEAYSQAIDDFTSAIDLNKMYPSADSYIGRAFAHQAIAYLDGIDKTAELKAARADMTRATEIEPGKAWHWHNLGSVLQDEEDPAASDTLRKAIGMFKWDVQHNTKNASAYEGLGWTYWRLNELDQALKAFANAIAANSKLSGGYQGKAYVLNAQGQPSEACAAIATGLTELPSNTALERAQEQLGCQ